MRSNCDMAANIYDINRITIENYRTAYMRKDSYSASMTLRQRKLTHILEMYEIAKSKGLANSISDFGLKAGGNKTTLNKYWAKDNISTPSNSTLEKLAIHIGYATYDNFLRRDQDKSKKIQVIEIPIMADVPGGMWSEAIDHATETLNFAYEKPGDYIAVRIRGGSINRIASDGEIAVIDRSQTNAEVLHDQPIIALMDGEVTAKVFRRNPDRLDPYSDDPSFKTIYPTGQWEILGKIVSVQRKLPQKF